jgi:two-component system OmpR family response regulator
VNPTAENAVSPAAPDHSQLSLMRGRIIGSVRVLLVEDDVRMSAALQRALRAEGILVDVATCAFDALWMTHATRFDATVLDVMLPDLDGFQACERLRAEGVCVPVIMLTARDAVHDRVRGLDAGADDYLTKPFSLAELLARLRALFRREPLERPEVLEVGDLRLDPATRDAWRADEPLPLSTREFSLLEAFMRRPGQAIGRRELVEAAWDHAHEHRSNVIEVYMSALRDKIDRPFGVESLETVRGLGYRLRQAQAVGSPG